MGAATALLLLLALGTGCSGGDGDGGEASSDLAVSQEGEAAVQRLARDGDGSANRAAVQTRAVIKTGQVAVTSDDLDVTRQEVDDLLRALGGNLDSERTSHDEDGKIESSTLVIRVPVVQFRAAMDALENLGKMETSSSKSRDVTTEVIDVNERVETIKNSLDRLQKFQRQSNNIDDLIRFEDQITERQSELSSLEAQQEYLADQTSFSTITLYLSTPETYVEPPDPLDDAGFVAGLKGGWNALKDAVVVALTVLGAVLPFVVALGLLGVPLWLLVGATRRRNRLAPPAQPTTPDAG